MLRLVSFAALATAFDLSPVAIPSHMQWEVSDEGLVQARYTRSSTHMHLNVAGGTISNGAEVVLGNCQIHRHEEFKVVGTQIKLAGNEGLCLQVEGGVGVGHRVITFHCGTEGDLSPNEEFIFDDGFIKMKHNLNLCLNVKGGEMKHGKEIIIYQCQDGNDNELFKVEGLEISMTNKPELHFNIAGGDISNIGHPVVLYGCHLTTHELFEFKPDGRIHLKEQPTYCLNSEGGLGAGHKIIIGLCHADETMAQELWSYNADTGAIFATKDPQLGFNAAGAGLAAGDEVVVWPYREHTEL